MKQYHQLVGNILEEGEWSDNRTGIRTKQVFGRQMEFNLQESFPALTTKKVFLRGAFEEMMWFIRGETNVKPLNDRGIHYWDANADENGDLGPVYGQQWRNWGLGCDQIADVLHALAFNKSSRRIIINSWNVDDLPDMRLPPCVYSVQFHVRNGHELDLMITQRSCDVFLGLPMNLANYAFLAHIIAMHRGLEVGKLVWSGANVHIYENHMDQARELLSRSPDPARAAQVRMLRSRDRIEDYVWEDVEVTGYDPLPAIAAPMAV